ncbi:MAG: DUF692 domain-containing protein [Acidiferrobacterales bacterium]|nr:DUF692 domain-containing protein [Acidiferrobacterales bacterium]
MSRNPIPQNSVGVGLRAQHYRDAISNPKAVDWFEVHSENYFRQGGAPHFYLNKVRQDHPISFHGVGLSLGSTDPLNLSHLTRLKELVDIYQPTLVSEHLSWSSVDGVYLHDLLPLPMTEESQSHLAGRIGQVQDFLGRQILIENASTYLEFSQSQIPEWEFICEISNRSGCRILCDVNNVYVNSRNHRFSATEFIEAVDPDLVGEIHLSGHTVKQLAEGEIRIDTHDQRVCDEVWELYRLAVRRFRHAPTLIEWDKNLPDYSVLLDEANTARSLLSESTHALA